tara:strand:+ start:21202 stop:22266 length:1065 start_codon:yes stop_codon:yes gene_type:complete
MSFDKLNEEVAKGMAGGNTGIPMGFDRLNRYVGIRKSIYTLIGGNTGSGKTSFLDDSYVLNPCDWMLSAEGKASGKSLKIIYRSMERSRTYKLAKWVGRKIFKEYGVIIPVTKLLGWTETMTSDEHDLYLLQRDYVGELESIITIFDGPENPIGIAKDLKAYAEENGVIERLDEHNRIYIPNNNNEITIVILDHIGLLKTTKELNTKKQVIEKMSDELRYARDFYGYSPVVISQLNRDISNPIRIKNGDVEPQLEDFKESSQTQEDADIVMALFDPIRYKVQDPSGYELSKLKDGFGAKYFRSLRILKNSFGEDDIRVGLGFMGQIGTFKELYKQKDMTDADYASVVDKTWFKE